jgi:hypothetical protein
MKIAKNITERQEPFEFDMQLIATELDTSAKHLKYVAKETLNENDHLKFDKLVTEIETTCPEIESFDDNTILYEYLEEAVIVHTVFGVKYVIFDSMIAKKIEERLNSYEN